MIAGLRSILFTCLLGLTGLASVAPAADASALFDNANKLYEGRKYPEAAATYEAILDGDQTSPAVFFNLGNARFKAGQVGRAIVAYRKAAQLTPRDPDVRANLQFARNQVQGPTLRPSRWEQVFGGLSLNEWAGLTVTGLWLTFLLLAAMQIRPALRPTLRNLTLLLGGGSLVLSGCLLAAALMANPRDRVVVLAPDIIVHQGPLEESQSAFAANDGAELRVLDRKDDWLQVTDGSRRIGWLKRSEVATF